MAPGCTTFTGLLGISLGVLIAGAARAPAAEQRPLWLAVVRPELAAPLQPLAENRRSEGLEAVISTKSVAEALAAAPRRPDFLLLVGDDQPGMQQAPWYLPTKRMKLYRWRKTQAEEFAADAAWGDLDGDLLPDIPVGRIPAQTRAQVELAVRKILLFERRPPTAADLQLVVWLGSPEYGAVIDTVASGFGVGMVRTAAPAWLCPWFISGNPRDPFCGWPPDQPARFTRQIKQGGLLSVLLGHASAETFFSMTFQQQIAYTAADAAHELAKGPPAAPMFFFSCESGAFVGGRPCLAKSLLFLPGGPVATIGATTESHPLTNYFSSVCLLKGLAGREKRLGTVWLNAQRQARQSRNFLVEMALRDVEGKLEPQINVEKLRRDQMLMYALLGDPATRLRLPEPLKASIERTAAGWRWKAEKPAGATHLEVGYRSAEPVPSPEGTGAAQEREQRARAAEAANAALAFTSLPAPPDNGPWEGTVDRPGWVRLVATGPDALYAIVLKLPAEKGDRHRGGNVN
jgi:hypothetical protein